MTAKLAVGLLGTIWKQSLQSNSLMHPMDPQALWVDSCHPGMLLSFHRSSNSSVAGLRSPTIHCQPETAGSFTSSLRALNPRLSTRIPGSRCIDDHYFSILDLLLRHSPCLLKLLLQLVSINLGQRLMNSTFEPASGQPFHLSSCWFQQLHWFLVGMEGQ